MHHRMSPSKIGWPSLNLVIFPPSDAPHNGRHKTVNTMEIIDQINEIILEDCRISAKSIAEQLGISCERVGCIIHGDLDMRKRSAKWAVKERNLSTRRTLWQSATTNLTSEWPEIEWEPLLWRDRRLITSAMKGNHVSYQVLMVGEIDEWLYSKW